MIKCHQCDSDVAENDAFCPFCGISLEPVAVATDEDEFASTIMMPPPSSASEVSHHQPTQASEPIVEGVEIPEPVAHSDSQQDVPTTQIDQPDYDDIPTPPALAQLEQADNERLQDQLKPTGDEHSDHVSPALKENFQEPAPANENYPTAAAQEPEPSAPILEEQPAHHFDQQPQHNFGEQEASRTADDAQQAPEIAMPDDVLEVPDAGPSMFDSVRIMDDRYTPTEPRQSEQAAPESPPSAANSERIAKSHTASGMGLVDTDGRRSSKLKPLEEGVVLNNRYEIVRKIGGGGMGAVYLASDNNLGGVLRAVKEMVQAHIEEEQQAKAIEDFRRESMILSQLDHPAIPTIYDYFFDEEECRFYLVMKYISGGDLAARLRAAPEGKIDEKSVTEWGIQIADVLDYLHSQPTTIVYRDLKPSNIMIDGNTGRVMLIDFGIARSINQKEEKGVTAVGTMGYAPPELFSGNVEPRSDIYSLGSTMFHLLTGADPQSNPLLIFDFQKNPRPRQINPQLSDQIELFLMTAVEYNASARFASAAEVRSVLTEHLANLNKGAVTFGIKEAPESVSLANQPVFCGFCGQRIVATDLFCAFCGAKQPIAQKGVHSEIYGKGAVTAKLLVEGTSELQSPVFSLEKGEILIGRRDPMSNIFPEVDLSKFDPQTKISRRHARIWREGNTFLVEDLGSSNGTVLVPIVHDSFRLAPRQPQALTNGDKIRVGDTTLHFVVN